jgi:endonuclease YncB( thermonuclease family)
VIDGDTAEMHGVRIRLWGIDAPESSQLCRGEDSLQYHCGAQAANELDAFIDRRPINCVPVSLDPYGRTVATCSVAGRDLGEWLVQNGLALDWPNTRRAGITKLSARLSAPARESAAATSSRGSIVHISAQADDANAHP